MIDKAFILASDTNGFGVKFHGKLNIIGIQIIGAEFELVYLVDRLGESSKYAQMYEIMKGDEALRIRFAFLTSLPVIPLGLFIKLKGVSNSLSIRPDPATLLLQSEAEMSALLGLVKASTVVTISPRELNFRVEGRIWDVFYAEIECSVYHNENWASLTVNVSGKLVAKATDGSSFESSYYDGIRRAIQKI